MRAARKAGFCLTVMRDTGGDWRLHIIKSEDGKDYPDVVERIDANRAAIIDVLVLVAEE